MSRLTKDNRAMDTHEEYLMARIEALQRRVKELEGELAKTKTTKLNHWVSPELRRAK